MLRTSERDTPQSVLFTIPDVTNTRKLRHPILYFPPTYGTFYLSVFKTLETLANLQAYMQPTYGTFHLYDFKTLETLAKLQAHMRLCP